MTVDPTSSEQPAPGQAGVDPAVRARIAEADFDLRNASMMVKKPGWTLRLLGTFFFKKVRFEPEQVDTLRDLAVDGSVIYVLPSQSLLDYLYFNWAFLHQKLPLAVYGKGMRMWPFRTLAAQLRSMFRWAFRRRKPKAESDILFQAPAQRRPVVLFLRRARALLPWAGDFDEDPLRDVVEAREALDTPVHLVPMMVVWERAPGGFRRGMFDTVFGDPDAPGRLRKVINFIGNHRRALVQLGDPIEVGAFIEEHKHLERREAVGQKIRWALNHGFRVERKVIKGPVLKDAAQIREEILRLGDFQQELSEIAHERGVPLAEVQEEADGYLEEIVADWKLSYIEMFCILLTFVFSRIYAGIEVKGLPSVREAARKAPLVILPSHKSHLDYLLVSYVFYIHGLVPPHIAAGQNLSFWPMGHLFRRSGAFFLRRSFGINPLYASTFRTYVHKLIKAGYTLEFFLEGGRSRTGKLLPPKYGLLSNVVDAVMSGVVHDVQMVPASICYEKIVEGEGYARELSGRPKENENLGQLVNATKVLAERFGQVYLSFPQPFSLREYLESLGLDLEAGFDDDDHRRHVVKALGYRVLGDVNSATVVTASAVVATALLANPRRGISRPELLRRSGAVLDYVLQTRAPLAATLQHQLAANRASLERARSGVQGTLESALANFDGDGEMARVLGETLGLIVDETIALFAKSKILTVHEYADRDSVYQLIDDRRIELDYYKNNLIHLFARESLLACALLRCWREDDLWGDRLRSEVEFVSRLLKTEYVFDRSDPFDSQYRGILESFERAGLLQANRAARVALAPSGMDALTLLAGLTLPLIEGYYIALLGVERLEEPVPFSVMLTQLQRSGDRLWRKGRIAHREAISGVAFSNALRRFQADGWLGSESRPEGRKGKPVRYVTRGEAWSADTIAAARDRIGRFLTSA